MPDPRRLLRLGALATVAAAPPTYAQSQTRDDRLPHERLAAVDSLITREMRAQRIPGVAVAVVDNGKTVLARAYGLANLETGTPVDTGSVFELASVTKPFTASAIMLLVEEGKIQLDDPIGKFLEQPPEAWTGITVRHLLTHTSGLPIDALPDYHGSPLLRITSRQALEFAKGQRMMFPPGQGAFYSDIGYFLLGLVIEKASGQTYREFMQRRIFDRLGMAATSILDKVRILRRRVATYEVKNGELVNWRRDWDYEVPSFFGIFSTLGDLVKWDLALRQASILDRASLEQMWTPAKLDNGHPARVLDQLYGLGWVLADVAGHPTVGHGGASGTYLLRFIDRPISVVLLTNRGVNGRAPSLLAQAIAGTLYPALRSPLMASPVNDPDAALAGKVATLFSDMVAKHDSPVMSEMYRAWYNSTSPPWRSWTSGQLSRLGSPRYLGAVPIGGRSIWGAEPLDRLVYYTFATTESRAYVTIGVAKEGSIGRFDLIPR